jgi:hypothetical protein
MLLALYSQWGDFDQVAPGVSFIVFARIIIGAFLFLQLFS